MERPFVGQILESGQTGIMDRGDQRHKTFDLLQSGEKHFVCRIRSNTKKSKIKLNQITAKSIVFYDAVVLLGTPGVNQTEKEIRLIGYLLLAIYCHKKQGEKVNIKRVRALRNMIQNKSRQLQPDDLKNFEDQGGFTHARKSSTGSYWVDIGILSRFSRV